MLSPVNFDSSSAIWWASRFLIFSPIFYLSIDLCTILRSAKIGYRAVYACALNYCDRETSVGAPHRRLERQICVVTALAVHSDRWPVTFSPLPIESSRASPALAVSRL